MPTFLLYQMGASSLLDPLPQLVRSQEPIDARLLAPKVLCELWTGPGNTVGPAGPNYDGTPGSILAALLYQPVRGNQRWLVLKHLIRNNQQWVSGGILTHAYGSEALRRWRELRDPFDWPVDRRPPPQGRGVWEYSINLDPSHVQWALSQIP